MHYRFCSWLLQLMDGILVDGATTSEHLPNLHSLVKHLEEKGVCCCLEK